MAVRTKLLALGLTFCFLASLILFIASPALASEGEGEGSLGPSPENGLLVAVGGVLGIYVFLGLILFRVLRKRKKQMMQM